jgi:hypothetical protein
MLQWPFFGQTNDKNWLLSWNAQRICHRTSLSVIRSIPICGTYIGLFLFLFLSFFLFIRLEVVKKLCIPFIETTYLQDRVETWYLNPFFERDHLVAISQLKKNVRIWTKRLWFLVSKHGIFVIFGNNFNLILGFLLPWYQRECQFT